MSYEVKNEDGVYRFRTKKEATWSYIFLGSEGSEGLPVFSRLPATHYLEWLGEGSHVETSKKGKLPPQDVDVSVRTMRRVAKVEKSSPPQVGKTTSKGRAVKSYRVGFDLRFKTREEAELYQSRGSSVRESKKEANVQMVWVENGFWYGSGDGLLPDPNTHQIQVEYIGIMNVLMQPSDLPCASEEVGCFTSKETEANLLTESPPPSPLEALRTPEDVVAWLDRPILDRIVEVYPDKDTRPRFVQESNLLRARLERQGKQKPVVQESPKASEETPATTEGPAEEPHSAEVLPKEEVLGEGSSSSEPSVWAGAFGFLALLGLVGKGATSPRKRVDVIGAGAPSWESVGLVEDLTDEAATEEYLR